MFIQDAFAPTGVSYSFANNSIFLSSEFVEKLPPDNQFASIYHEIIHYMQNMQVLRHEELGPKVVEKYADNLANQEITVLKECQNYYPTREGLYKDLVGTEEQKEITLRNYDRMKKILENNDKQELEKFTQEFKNYYANKYNKFRDTVIKHWGVIKKDSDLTSKIQTYFDEIFKGIHYLEADGRLNIKKYGEELIEQEANTAETQALSEITNTCPVKIIKDNLYAYKYNREAFEQTFAGLD